MPPLPTILVFFFWGGWIKGQLSLCSEQTFFQWHGNEKVYGAIMSPKQTFLLCAFIATSCLQWGNSTINQWRCTTVPKLAINNLNSTAAVLVLTWQACLNSDSSIEPLLSPLQKVSLLSCSYVTRVQINVYIFLKTFKWKAIEDTAIGRVPWLAVNAQ